LQRSNHTGTRLYARDKRRRYNGNYVYCGPSDAIITDSMCSYQRKNYQSMVLLYKGGGFTNVTAIPLHDLSLLNQMLNGQVESVTINGTDGFEEGDVFPKDSNVIITYHCK